MRLSGGASIGGIPQSCSVATTTAGDSRLEPGGDPVGDVAAKAATLDAVMPSVELSILYFGGALRLRPLHRRWSLRPGLDGAQSSHSAVPVLPGAPSSDESQSCSRTWDSRAQHTGSPQQGPPPFARVQRRPPARSQQSRGMSARPRGTIPTPADIQWVAASRKRGTSRYAPFPDPRTLSHDRLAQSAISCSPIARKAPSGSSRASCPRFESTASPPA